ncbi:hypothetical protein KEJ51_04265 [Candidatus Bathyarchaeota archaeon]|nr:hypothetical protein [Candidatus Bathyarchaeota archaeon]
MDLISDFRRALDVLRYNMILFLPSLIIFYLVPIMVLIAAFYVLTPITYTILKVQASNLIYGLIFGITVLATLAGLTYIYVLSGAANMNKKAVLTGSTSMKDFWDGCDKYFLKILAGTILLATVYAVIVLVGIILTSAILLPYTPKLTQMIKLQPENILKRFEPVTLLEALEVLIDPISLWLLLLTCMGIFFIFTVFWIQALVIEDVGVFRAVGLSVRFVKKNMKTTLGIASLWLISQGLVVTITPYGFLDGGSSGCLFAVAPIPQILLQPIIATFFTLLLYVTYADKTGRIQPSTLKDRGG